MSRRHRRAMRALGLGLVALASTACHSWRPATTPPQTLIEMEQPRRVRATLDDGRVLTLTRPMLVADSIVGTTRLGREGAPAVRLTALEVERSSVPKTLAIIVAHASVVISAIALIIDVQPHYRGF